MTTPLLNRQTKGGSGMRAGVVSGTIPIWRACCAQAREFQAEPEAGALTPAGKGCCAFDSPDELLSNLAAAAVNPHAPSIVIVTILHPRCCPTSPSSAARIVSAPSCLLCSVGRSVLCIFVLSVSEARVLASQRHSCG